MRKLGLVSLIRYWKCVPSIKISPRAIPVATKDFVKATSRFRSSSTATIAKNRDSATHNPPGIFILAFQDPYSFKKRDK